MGFIPIHAFKWKINQEKFLQDSKIISDLGIRLGYGITGQQDGIGNYSFLTTYSIAASNWSYLPIWQPVLFKCTCRADMMRTLSWEQTATSNIGLDYGFLKNRITGSVDFYLKKTSKLLESIPEPAGTNFSAFILSNVGNMKNEGVEFNINAQPIKHKNMTWDVNFNIAYNKNTITNLTVIPDDPTIRVSSGQITEMALRDLLLSML